MEYAEIERAKTKKDTGQDQTWLKTWWQHFRCRKEMIDAVAPLNRYIACSDTTKRPVVANWIWGACPKSAKTSSRERGRLARFHHQAGRMPALLWFTLFGGAPGSDGAHGNLPARAVCVLFSYMSTLAEIEATADALPMSQKEELFRFLSERLRVAGSALTAPDPIDLSTFEGVLTLREDPMDYQNRVRSEWP